VPPATSGEGRVYGVPEGADKNDKTATTGERERSSVRWKPYGAKRLEGSCWCGKGDGHSPGTWAMFREGN
jgi:hypothetical protein